MGQDQGQQGQQQQQGSGQHVSSSTDAPMFAKRPQTQGEQPQGGRVCGHGHKCEDGGGEGRHLSQGQGNPDPGAQSVGVQGEGREGGQEAVGIQQAGGGREGSATAGPNMSLKAATRVINKHNRGARPRDEGRRQAGHILRRVSRESGRRLGKWVGRMDGQTRTRPHEGLETAIAVKADGDREARSRVEGRHAARQVLGGVRGRTGRGGMAMANGHGKRG